MPFWCAFPSLSISSLMRCFLVIRVLFLLKKKNITVQPNMINRSICKPHLWKKLKGWTLHRGRNKLHICLPANRDYSCLMLCSDCACLQIHMLNTIGRKYRSKSYKVFPFQRNVYFTGKWMAITKQIMAPFWNHCLFSSRRPISCTFSACPNGGSFPRF